MTNTKIAVNTGPGCFGLVIAIIMLWALLFGVNYDGKHYGLSCGSKGVDIHTGTTR